MRDFNINTLLYNTSPNVNQFIDMMYSHTSVNLINKPTRFPRGAQFGSPSLLDHFYTNKIDKVKNIGLLVCDISDHFPIVATISINHKKLSDNDVFPYIRDFRNFDVDTFNESLINFDDNEMLSLDERFENVHSHILSCINLHIPLREKTKKEKKFALKPWISNSLKRSILHKKRLYNISRIPHPSQSTRINDYNRYKKKLEKALFAAQCKYFENEIIDCQNNSKAVWKMINEIARRKKANS